VDIPPDVTLLSTRQDSIALSYPFIYHCLSNRLAKIVGIICAQLAFHAYHNVHASFSSYLPSDVI
jgi:hypothetical protein